MTIGGEERSSLFFLFLSQQVEFFFSFHFPFSICGGFDSKRHHHAPVSLSLIWRSLSGRAAALRYATTTTTAAAAR